MKMQALSVKEQNFTDKQTGEVRKMWQVYCPDETGAVGSIYSTEPVRAGDQIEVKMLVNRDGRFAAKILNLKKDGPKA